ncbi:MAG: ribosome-associated translation inhibitor RaiA [Nitrospirae bacterium]|nr:ribosome-associated translation inhibitor RaiA [Nitrospirota bacterium]
MNITVSGRNFDMTEAIRDYAENKIKKFDKLLAKDPGTAVECNVTLIVEKYRHKAEVLIQANGMVIQAESITGEMYASIDEVIEKLDRQIVKHKEKLSSKRKSVSKEVIEDHVVLAEEHERIIKEEKFEMKPMNPEEAAMQLELLGKDFYVFTNTKTGDINVIYIRKDGNFGLIEPVK